METAPSPALVLGRLADERRLSALAAIALGATRAGKRRLVLESVAGRLELDREYGEHEINAFLLTFYDDHASLRRHLVDEGLLMREGGVYRRVTPTAPE